VAFSSSTRSVLIIGDEGLQVYSAGRMSTKHVEFIAWDTENFKDVLKHTLAKKCGKKPVVILNDMVEQHYRKERIPKVNIADRANIIKSRLNFAFPNNQIRAALKLNKKNNISADGKPGHPYLFAAVPKTEFFNQTFNAVIESGSKLVGFYLLPVEGVGLIEDLSKKANKGNKIKSVWTIFLGQQQNGGLRQIVTRNGELALTRMTPIVDTDIEPALWSRELSEELKATMSYLARFGYKKTDGLDIFIVANGGANETLQQYIDIDADLRIMTSTDIARMLSLKIGVPPDLRYTDPLYAAYLGKRSKFLLPMQSKAIEDVTRPRKIAGIVALGLLLCVGYVGFLLFQTWQQKIVLDDSLAVTQQQLINQKQQFDTQVENTKALGFDFKMVDAALENYYQIKQEKIDPLPLMTEIGRSLGIDLTIDKIEMRPVDFKKPRDPYAYIDPNDPPKKEQILKTVLTLSFPRKITPEQGVQQVNSFAQRLETNLPNYDVKIIKQVADLSYTGNVTGGNDAQNPEEEDYFAEIEILENEE